MTVSLIIFLALVLAVLWFVVSPMLNKDKNDYSMLLDNSPDSRKDLQAKRSQLMLNIRELDFDFETGKLSKEDYKQMRGKVEQDTIDVLKKIEIEDEHWSKFQKDLEQTLGKKKS